MTKANYLERWPLGDLLWDGTFDDPWIISTSSGSSGVPFYWPRGAKSHRDAVLFNGAMFEHFDTRARQTLCVNSFAMGTYIAATYELAAILTLAQRGHRVTLVCPSIDVENNVRVLAELSGQFEQTILMGYPPFIKDVIDAARLEGVTLSAVRMIFAGENFSEAWRDHVHGLVNASDPYRSSLSIYGTADAGIIGTESPYSIYIRRCLATNPEFREALLGESDGSSLPTLVEVQPQIRHIEDSEGYILFTADTSLPLIRYRIGDRGSVLPGTSVRRALDAAGLGAVPDPLSEHSERALLTIYGRTDVATSFYSVNIYPENIKDGLETEGLPRLLSGKFIVTAPTSADTHQPSLRLKVEMAAGVHESRELTERVRACVTAALVRTNAEYRSLRTSLRERADPVVDLVPNGADHFRVGIKHRWTKADE